MWTSSSWNVATSSVAAIAPLRWGTVPFADKPSGEPSGSFYHKAKNITIFKIFLYQKFKFIWNKTSQIRKTFMQTGHQGTFRVFFVVKENVWTSSKMEIRFDSNIWNQKKTYILAMWITLSSHKRKKNHGNSSNTNEIQTHFINLLTHFGKCETQVRITAINNYYSVVFRIDIFSLYHRGHSAMICSSDDRIIESGNRY